MRSEMTSGLLCLFLVGGGLACGGTDPDPGVSPDALRTGDEGAAEPEAESTFGCGLSTCNVKTEYCVKRTTYSDLNAAERRMCISGRRGSCVSKKITYRCNQLPASCGDSPSCSCLDAETCSGSAQQGLSVSAITDNRD